MKRAKTQTKGIRKLTWSALFTALALVLPFLTGQIPEIGSMLCPMHLPVLLCGFLCGWPWGLAVGFVSPLLRSAVFGMPTAMKAIAMAVELAVYGAASGGIYRLLPERKWSVSASLLCAMILGRLAWGGVQMVLMGLQNTQFTFAMFLASTVTGSVPGIVLQLVLVPLVVMALQRAKVMTSP